MGTICEPLAADLFPFCYNKKDFLLFLSEENQAYVTEAFNLYRYLTLVMLDKLRCHTHY